jgi:hypothetical protein
MTRPNATLFKRDNVHCTLSTLKLDDGPLAPVS